MKLRTGMRFGIISLLVLCFTGLIAWLGIKHVYTQQAHDQAQSIIASLPIQKGENKDKFIAETTRYVFKNFTLNDPPSHPFLKIRYILTNRHLPEFLRLQDGVIEMYTQSGMCDNAVRMLSFILNEAGIQSRQWNMITPYGGHSAALVILDNDRKALADPLFGYITQNKDGEFITPETAQLLLKKGKKFESVFKSLDSESDPGFYKFYTKASMAAQGDQLKITATLPKIENQSLHIGKINSSPDDVIDSLSNHGLSPNWHYVGSRYDRNRTRILKTTQPVRIEMVLTDPVRKGIITSEPIPEIKENKMIWNLKAGEQITFHDGKAKRSLLRMKSYIDVDQISIYLMN